MMKIRLTQKLLILLFIIQAQSAFSQVTGISYTLSPSAEYTRWDDKAGLENAFLLGGKLGIGFGEYLELRGSYMQAINLKTNFSNFGLPNFSDSLFVSRDVKLSRWGGEIKANLSRGKLLPFLTLGTGVQSVQLDTFAVNKNIYVSLGAGLVFSLGDRYTLTLEGKNTPFNFNAGRNLLSPEDKTTFDVTETDFKVDQLKQNWSLNASLQFYLGGRRPGQLSELDKAYMATFSDGLKGLRIPLEFTLARINFDATLPYRSTWMGGAYLGLDFNDYIGIRGFYLRAMQGDKISTDFDDLAMYGGELRLKLNAARGLTPYLSFGGGYLSVDNKYVPKDTIAAYSQAFASGGLGITLPLSNRFNIFGSARAILTSGAKVDNLQTTDEIQTSTMYSAGVRFILGKKSDPNAVFQSEVNTALQTQQAANDEKALQLKQEYETKAIELETQLNEAYATQDIEQAAALLKEKETTDQILAELNKRTMVNAEQKTAAIQPATIAPGLNVVPSNSRIQLTAAEFENLIEEILENMGTGDQRMSGGNMPQTATQSELENRIAALEKLLDPMKEQTTVDGPISNEAAIRRDLTEFSAKLLVEMQKINEKVDQNNTEIQSIKENGTGTKEKIKSDPNLPKQKEAKAETQAKQSSVTEGNVLEVETSGDFVKQDTTGGSKLRYEGMSAFVGANLIPPTTLAAGLRWHYGIGKSKFEMMPEVFFDFTTPVSFGLTVNIVRPFAIKKTPFTPYLGIGGGFMQDARIVAEGNEKLQGNYNFIVGTYLNVLGGRVYVDFTGRNILDYQQLVVGYRFSF